MSDNIRAHRGISPNLGKKVYIDRTATVIGNVTLGDDVSVWPGAVIRGDMHKVITVSYTHLTLPTICSV